MRNHILNLTLISGVLLASLFGCGTDAPEARGTKYEITKEQYTFYADIEKYKEANAKRADDDECNFSWKVLKVTRDGNVLTVDVSRPKDCEVKYELIWDGVLFYSHPMIANIFLKTKPIGCSSQTETMTDTLIVDLEETFKETDQSNLSNINFNIKEFCSIKDIECTEDCNVVSGN